MKKPKHLAIIGSGATAIYLLKHVLNHVQILRHEIGSISIFEKSQITGVGMPYSPQTTDRFNMSNISSEELPELQEIFVDWLQAQDDSTLAEHGIVRDEISATHVYDRLTLGKYLNAQYRAITEALSQHGILLNEHSGCKVLDLVDDQDAVHASTSCLGTKSYDMIFIATGHLWDGEDRPRQGYYASPWPIFKLLPKNDFYHNYTIGTLGASLSAFDVITSLAHRHGSFIEEGKLLRYEPFPGTENFSLVMHAAHGWLPHLQFDQHEPLREIYRHTNRENLLALRDSNGFLRISEFFDKVCRPALIKAFTQDDMPNVVAQLQRPEFGLESFVTEMTREHEYDNAFEGMKYEMIEARDSVEHHQPIHWKEVLDDLMFCLNFHVELLPAEDHHTFLSVVMPFLMNVIAALPLKSGNTLLAL